MKTRKRRRKTPSVKQILFSAGMTLLLAFIAWLAQHLEPPSRSAEVLQSSRGSTHGSIELYSNSDDLAKLYETAIRGARQSIDLIIYALTDPRILTALREQSQKGIAVRVVADAQASPHLDQKLGSKVRTLRRFGPGLLHQKLLVIDGQYLLAGSANLTPESLTMYGNLVTRLDCPQAAALALAKADSLKIEGRCQSLPWQSFQIGNQQIEFWFLPDNRQALARVQQLLATAKKSVQVAMFTWTSRELAQSTVQAAERGVKVDVVIDHNSGKGCSAKIVKLLKKKGVAVSLSQGGPLLHHKFVLIDGETLVNGSANWTHAAFNKNDDCFLVLHPLNEAQKKQMQRIWSVIKNEAVEVKNDTSIK